MCAIFFFLFGLPKKIKMSGILLSIRHQFLKKKVPEKHQIGGMNQNHNTDRYLRNRSFIRLRHPVVIVRLRATTLIFQTPQVAGNNTADAQENKIPLSEQGLLQRRGKRVCGRTRPTPMEDNPVRSGNGVVGKTKESPAVDGQRA